MKAKKYFNFLLIFLLFVGCAKTPNVIENTASKVIFFNTKDLRFYDMGFVRTYANGDVSLEIFNAGHLLFRFSVLQNQICLNQKCYSKEMMVRRLFGSDALRGLDFSAVLQGREIFGGENKKQSKNGYEQSLRYGENEILYKVEKEEIFFYEKKSKFKLVITNPN